MLESNSDRRKYEAIRRKMAHIKNILTVAGSDSGGGAGIQADLKTIMANGCYGLTVISALTAQNGCGVSGIEAPSPQFVLLQLKTVLEGFNVSAAKTGMLFSEEIIKAIAPALAQKNFPLVADPVCVSQSGSPLLKESAVEAMKKYIIPLADLLTPNLPEIELLTGVQIKSPSDIRLSCEKIIQMGAGAVLLKGGHMENAIMSTDYLLQKDGKFQEFSQAKIDTSNNHGTGCTLSAAIACGLGQGLPLEAAVVRAQRYINLALRKSYNPGKGCGPVNHAANLSISII